VAAAQLRRAAQGGAQLEAARAPAGPTAQQRRLATRLFELQDARDWRGVVALEKEALALARELRGADSEMVSWILNVLGLGFESTGDYGRARELYEQDRAICEALGDRAGVAAVCAYLGNCYRSTGDYGRALEMPEQARAILAALGDRAGVA
jgi:tetratricopeptide (TPR) repeat protein